MSKLMSVLGIILLAVGLALALVGLVNPAQMQVYGLSLDTAATLFVGGVLAVGLGGVIAALQQGVSTVATTVAEAAPATPEVMEEPVERMEAAAAPEPVVEAPAPVAEPPPSRVRFNAFGRRAAESAGAAAATAAAATVVVQETTTTAVASGKSAVDDTIAALEQAKADIANAVGGVASITEEKVEAVVEDVVEDDVEEEAIADDLEEGELYVVEERDIRGRPARILSDNTVEAETDEGWMRFENLEHLNEYMDAMEADA
jgi:hypothetical protein